MKRLTLTEFINRSQKKHGTRFDYSKSVYLNTNTKVEIICPIHGSFFQRAEKHMNGNGCPNCAKENAGLSKLEFVQMANSVHNNRYCYDNLIYVNWDTKVVITCYIHGDFKQFPRNHVSNKQGCPKCNLKSRKTIDEFIIHAIRIHGKLYNYDKVVYVNNYTKVKIICYLHGVFEQTPANHIHSQQGCPICSGNIRKTTNTFIEQAIKVHGDKYDYSKVEYISSKIVVSIICPTHGEFLQTPNNHLFNGSGCIECGYEVSRKVRIKDSEIFINQANQIHNNKYNYSQIEYDGAFQKIKIICPTHGEFLQLPTNHLNKKSGCPKCSYQVSQGQLDIHEYISNNSKFQSVLEDRVNFPNLLLDITVLAKKLAIEYNGIYWHSINISSQSRFNKLSHLRDKLEECQKHGLRVLNIYEDEWWNSRPQMEQIIKNALGLIPNKIGARKCKIWSCLTSDPEFESHIKPFFQKYHHQGLKHKVPGIIFCLVYEKQIMACAYFGTNSYHNQNDCELIRYATKADWKVAGGLSKIMKAFTKSNPQVTKIISYCDARFFTGEGYKKAGFKQIDWTKPGFDVIVTGERKHRSCIIKSKLTSYFTQEELDKHTQFELAEKLGWFVVPDCGQLVFIYQ